MSLAPGQAISNSRVFWAAGGSGGGSPGQIPPLVLGPLPSIGVEGTRFAYQINGYGTLPITFALTDGAVPTGMTLDGDTGLITGTCVAPNGGLYNFTITATNDYGSVGQAFAILIDGTAPVMSYGGTQVAPAGTDTSYTTTTTGSTGGSPAVPIAYAFVGDPDPLLGATVNTSTGEVTIDPDGGANGNAYPATVRATNYFGHSDVAFDLNILTDIYWGEWHGALPGTFTAANITTDLFDNVTPGPRVETGLETVNWLSINPWLAFPATGVAYARVLAIPQGTLTGTIAMLMSGDLPWTIVDSGNINIPCASLTPAWPTPYQSGLVINNVPYDIYVITARTLAITILGNNL